MNYYFDYLDEKLIFFAETKNAEYPSVKSILWVQKTNTSYSIQVLNSFSRFEVNFRSIWVVSIRVINLYDSGINTFIFEQISIFHRERISLVLKFNEIRLNIRLENLKNIWKPSGNHLKPTWQQKSSYLVLYEYQPE